LDLVGRSGLLLVPDELIVGIIDLGKFVLDDDLDTNFFQLGKQFLVHELTKLQVEPQLVLLDVHSSDARRLILAASKVPDVAPQRLVPWLVAATARKGSLVRPGNHLAGVGLAVPFDNASAAPVKKEKVPTVDGLGAVPHIGLG